MGKAENKVEGYLQEQVMMVGGLCEKFVCPGERGKPDQLITWPDGTMKLVETKSKDGELSEYQMRDHRNRSKRRNFVSVLFTREQVDLFLELHRLHWEDYRLLRG